MSRPAITIYPNHPRVFFRDTDVATLQTRKDQTSGRHPWATWWAALTPYLDLSYDETTYWQSSFHLKMLAYSTAYKVTGNTTYAAEADGHARYYAQNVATSGGVGGFDEDERREGLLALTAVWDICFDQLSSTGRQQIGDAMIRIMDVMTAVNTELIDGHSRIDQAIAALGALALYGESGTGYNYASGASDASTRLNKALDFWYGGNASVTLNGYAAFDTERFYGSPSFGYGAPKGFWYSTLASWGFLQLLMGLKNACSTITLDGDAYDPFVSESWFASNLLWYLNAGLRPDGEHWKIGDTQRLSNPRIAQEQRLLAAMHSRYSSLRNLGTWLWSEWQAIQNAAGSESKYTRINEFILVDQTGAAEQSPLQAGTSKTGFFERPGACFLRNTWDYPQSTVFLVQAPEWYYRGHQHLDRGTLHLAHKKDLLLLSSGYYHSSDANAKYGGSHNRNWVGQSVAQSDVVLVDDGAATPHSNYDAGGSLTSYPSGEGGQYWKKIGSKRDPGNVNDMVNDAASSQPTLAWKAVEGQVQTKGMEKVYEDSSTVVLYANLRRAYLQESTDLGTSAERVTLYDLKRMYIKDQGHGMMLCVHRVKARLSSMTKRLNFRVASNPLLGGFTANGQWSSLGYRANAGLSDGGLLVVAHYNWATFTAQQVGGGSPITGEYQSQQFFFDPHDGSGGKNYPPAAALNSERHRQDLGLYRLVVKPKTAAVEDYFVHLIIPLDPNESTPNFTWITDPDYFGVTFTDGKAYKLHKTEVRWASPSDPVSGAAPPPPTGLGATTPASQRVDLTWNPVIVSDLVKYRVYRRVKV